MFRFQYANEAESLLQDYLDADGPQRDSATILLVAALNFQHKPARTAKLLQDVEPANVAATDLMMAAQSLAETNQPELAEQLVTAALAQDQPRPDALRLAIRLRLSLGKDDAAVRACRELARIAPSDPHPWIMLAALYEKRGYSELLIDVYGQIAKLSPRQADMARFGLVGVLMEAGDIRQARREFDVLKAGGARILDRSPLLEAELLRIEGKLDESLAIVEKVREQQPQHAKAMQLHGRILLAQSKTESAIEVLEALVAIRPDSNGVHYLLGQAYGRVQQFEKAQTHLRKHEQLFERDFTEFLTESGRRSPGETSRSVDGNDSRQLRPDVRPRVKRP